MAVRGKFSAFGAAETKVCPTGNHTTCDLLVSAFYPIPLLNTTVFRTKTCTLQFLQDHTNTSSDSRARMQKMTLGKIKEFTA
jgi:hypothetical protein